MGSYKYYQFKIREESANEEFIAILDSLLKLKDSVRFYNDKDEDVSKEVGLNIIS